MARSGSPMTRRMVPACSHRLTTRRRRSRGSRWRDGRRASPRARPTEPKGMAKVRPEPKCPQGTGAARALHPAELIAEGKSQKGESCTMRRMTWVAILTPVPCLRGDCRARNRRRRTGRAQRSRRPAGSCCGERPWWRRGRSLVPSIMSATRTPEVISTLLPTASS